MKVKKLLIFFCVFISIINISCLKKSKTSLKNHIVIGITSQPENLNPLFPLSSTAIDVNSLIYSNLLKLNDDLTSFSYELAKNYTFSEDSLQITFNLASDLFWHDGEKLTANDVVYTYQLQTNKDIAWDGFSYKKNISKVIAVNDSTVIFHFHKKTPFMLLDANEGKILPKHILSKIPIKELFQSDFSHNPIGSGPYKLSEWKSQQHLILTKNEKYYKKDKPTIPKIIFKIVNDKSLLFQQMIAEEVDIIHDLSARNIEKIQKNYPNITIEKYQGKDYDFIGWNLLDQENFTSLKNDLQSSSLNTIQKIKPHKLFGNQEVRRALSLAINKEEICKSICGNLAKPINGPFVLYGDFNQYSKEHEYNVTEAKKILQRQGWIDTDDNGVLDKNGEEFVFTMYTNSGNPLREQLLMVFQQNFKELKIKMIPKIVESNYHFSQIIINKKFDAILLGWNSSIKPDFTALFHSSQFLHPFHLTGYYSREFDQLNNKILMTKDLKTFNYYLESLVKLLSEDIPYTWLYTKQNVIVYNNRIANLKTSVLSKYKYLEDLKLK